MCVGVWGEGAGAKPYYGSPTFESGGITLPPVPTSLHSSITLISKQHPLPKVSCPHRSQKGTAHEHYVSCQTPISETEMSSPITPSVDVSSD